MYYEHKVGLSRLSKTVISQSIETPHTKTAFTIFPTTATVMPQNKKIKLLHLRV